ncbi:hypothetical protein [Staphylococcus delphini]|uniref:hypothetical protein n=1 Tax=Staphylococcus delphini TaxID=53344 RepID=UPI000BBCCB82|nr:hypothetical protein [Staphylococcus delphini]PCF36885.1 hypothetical protein B5B99_10235 [Staphylococcus delphini]PCF50657.1 hypothetical protein B5C03_11030 [Staphylococcus delphini]PCF55452.1 hypothetical protein B5B97_10385 [Staphylococcus delphini]PCF58304.1 hypothetical protein B5C05_10330 [Staphylococcus delphini]
MKFKSFIFMLVIVFSLSNIFSFSVSAKSESGVNYKNFVLDKIQKKEITVDTNQKDLNLQDIQVNTYHEKGKKYTYITVPYSDKYSLTSNLTLVLDKNKKVLEYSEAIVTKSDKNTFDINLYKNGKLVKHEITDFKYKNNKEIVDEVKDYKKNPEKYKKYEKGKRLAAAGFGKTALCLGAVLGVDLVVAKLIAGTCVSTCGAGVVPICAACVGGVATMGAANIGGVIACFKA